MKKLLIFFSILISSSLLFAASLGHSANQTIAGFINHTSSTFMNLDVTYDIKTTDGNYSGINLDVSDVNNHIRYLIAPSASHEQGLRFGTLTLEATNMNYKLHIFHTKLYLTQDSSKTIDYELSFSYAITGGESASAYCKSATNLNTDPSNPDNMINLSLRSSGGVILIQNAGLYFRLIDVSEVRTAGQYLSNIYVQVGTE